ncbi:MAG: endonuclease VII domain-containing protein [Dehalococcoidia bacterium]|nr:endonuclease VII domain-containing protein [Dehalococcoidia bacterium]
MIRNADKNTKRRENYKKNREHILKVRKRYKLKNPDLFRKIDKKYYMRNQKNRDEYREKWRKDNPLKQQRYQRKTEMKRKFNITIEQYEQMFESQNGCCAICGKLEVIENKYGIIRLAVDHDHKTDKIRGLLCVRCNVKLGILEDKDFCEKVEKYLKGFSNE